MNITYQTYGDQSASVDQWRVLARINSGVQPGPLGGDRKTYAVEARRDMAIQELWTELARLALSFA